MTYVHANVPPIPPSPSNAHAHILHTHTHTHTLTHSHTHSCSTTASAYAVCNVTDVANATIPGTAVLEQLNVTLPLYLNILALVLIGLGLRVLAYLALRFMHRP